MGYRPSRNIVATLIDYFTTEIDLAWSNIEVVNSFADAQSIDIIPQKAVVCIRVLDTDYLEVEIGSELRYRKIFVVIDIYASGEGQRLDLKDFIISKLVTMTYYEYVITSGVVSSKTATGKLILPSDIKDNIVNTNVDKASLPIQEQNRHRITAKLKLNKVE